MPVLSACHDCGRPTSVGRFCEACLPNQRPKLRPLRNDPARRARIIERDNGICFFCHLPGATVVHHIVPYAKGGSDADSNLAAAHDDCNKKAGDRVRVRRR